MLVFVYNAAIGGPIASARRLAGRAFAAATEEFAMLRRRRIFVGLVAVTVCFGLRALPTWPALEIAKERHCLRRR